MICPRKISHPTRRAALEQLRVMRAMRADGLRVKRLRIYPCRACGGWHVGYRLLSDGQIRIRTAQAAGEDPA
jgi:hypothetical protein